MKRLLAAVVVAALALLTAAPSALADDHDDLIGVSVTVENTIESQAFGFAEETPFGAQGPVFVNPGIVEFAACCDGFYAVDLSANQISMRWIGDSAFARVIEPGTFDRYYFTFGEPVLGSASINASSTLPANVTVLSPTQMLVEVAPGMQVGDGFDAIIDINTTTGAPQQLAFTGVSSWQLALIASAAILVGAAFVATSRNLELATESTRA